MKVRAQSCLNRPVPPDVDDLPPLQFTADRTPPDRTLPFTAGRTLPFTVGRTLLPFTVGRTLLPFTVGRTLLVTVDGTRPVTVGVTILNYSPGPASSLHEALLGGRVARLASSLNKAPDQCRLQANEEAL